MAAATDPMLKAAALAAGRLLGTAVDETALTNDPQYRATLAAEFDYVTPENATKWGPLEPTASNYDWTHADAIVQFARDNQMAVKGHTFLWYQQNPSWVSTSLSASELQSAIKSHIQTTMTHYQGLVRAWDVVNEAVDTETESGYKDNIFFETLGPDYIADAFRWAREADPDALLFYNEIGIERVGEKSDFAYQMLSDLLAQGVPIDGIGFQSHVSTHRYPSDTDLRANLARFAALGLRVNISEADVRDTVMPGSAEARALAQRIAYQQITAACVLEPACEGITLWGFTDEYTWLQQEGDFNPLVFTRDYQNKPAYQGVLDGLRGLLPKRGNNLLRNSDFAAGVNEWTTNAGSLSVAAASGRDGNAACVDGRSAAGDGLVQSELLNQLSDGGPFAFSAWVRADMSSELDASLLIAEQDKDPREFNIATTYADAGTWVELSGYLGLGFEATPLSVGLKVYGPAAQVQLCVADVVLQPLTVE
ncbi:MAG TPA: endo-1,4-beta-xylanase [Polyangiaceae bacterium]|nr:endo-1,4-beta-xylanase [Polyangiaceae bacterium]